LLQRPCFTVALRGTGAPSDTRRRRGEESGRVPVGQDLRGTAAV